MIKDSIFSNTINCFFCEKYIHVFCSGICWIICLLKKSVLFRLVSTYLSTNPLCVAGIFSYIGLSFNFLYSDFW